jgi:hypothetical protein
MGLLRVSEISTVGNATDWPVDILLVHDRGVLAEQLLGVLVIKTESSARIARWLGQYTGSKRWVETYTLYLARTSRTRRSWHGSPLGCGQWDEAGDAPPPLDRLAIWT